jgi:cell division protein ZapA (FtsZ GTPase activity inhibitor)
MAEEQKQMITINDKEYAIEDLTSDEQMMLAQINNLDGKIANLNAEMGQLQAARQFFVNNLSASVEAPQDVAEELAEE